MRATQELDIRQRPAPASHASGLLQRKCACGGSLSLSDECSGCQANRLSLQRSELAPAPASQGFVPSNGHHFNEVPVLGRSFAGAALSDPLSDTDAGTGTPTAADAGAPSCPSTKIVTLDFTSLRGATRDPYADLAFANTVYAPCCVNFQAVSGQTAAATDSDTWLGGDTVMERSTGGCGSGQATSEEVAAYQGAGSAFNLSGRVRVFYVESSHPTDRGRSMPPSCATGAAASIRNMLMVTNGAADRTLAHELGHILLDPGSHGMPADNLMHPTNTATGNNLTAAQCATIFANA